MSHQLTLSNLAVFPQNTTENPQQDRRASQCVHQGTNSSVVFLVGVENCQQVENLDIQRMETKNHGLEKVTPFEYIQIW